MNELEQHQIHNLYNKSYNKKTRKKKRLFFFSFDRNFLLIFLKIVALFIAIFVKLYLLFYHVIPSIKNSSFVLAFCFFISNSPLYAPTFVIKHKHILNDLYKNEYYKKKKEIVKKIITKSIERGIDFKETLSIAMVESSLIQGSVGLLGEIGIFQLRPKFFKGDIKDSDKNIEKGISYYGYCRQKTNSMNDAILCYNLGYRGFLIGKKNPSYIKKFMVFYNDLHRS